ncbi:helix-turn-helix domain-containing protein [Streptomyces sp. NPDC002640]
MVTVDRLLTVDQVAERLGTGVRFARRLVEERRIRYVKVGRHVRIAESAVRDYLDAHTVEPVRLRRAGLRRAA